MDLIINLPEPPLQSHLALTDVLIRGNVCVCMCAVAPEPSAVREQRGRAGANSRRAALSARSGSLTRFFLSLSHCTYSPLMLPSTDHLPALRNCKLQPTVLYATTCACAIITSCDLNVTEHTRMNISTLVSSLV